MDYYKLIEEFIKFKTNKKVEILEEIIDKNPNNTLIHYFYINDESSNSKYMSINYDELNIFEREIKLNKIWNLMISV